VLVLCMSANAFGSDWAQLESSTFRFRDPLEQGKAASFLCGCDDSPIKGTLSQSFASTAPEDRDRICKAAGSCYPQVQANGGRRIHRVHKRLLFSANWLIDITEHVKMPQRCGERPRGTGFPVFQTPEEPGMSLGGRVLPRTLSGADIRISPRCVSIFPQWRLSHGFGG